MVHDGVKMANPTFSGRVGSVTHIPEQPGNNYMYETQQHDSAKKSKNYFRNTRGTVPHLNLKEPSKTNQDRSDK